MGLMLSACASPALKEADALRAQGQPEQALGVLQDALRARPDDIALRTAVARDGERTVTQWLYQAEQAYATGRAEDARKLLDRIDTLQPNAPRAVWLRREMDRGARDERMLAEARTQMNQGRLETAEARVRELLAESPNHAGARALMQAIRQRTQRDDAALPPALAAAYQRVVSLEFRDAPLRSVFESISRVAGTNFVFDKDVRGDAKVTVFLRGVTVDEAMRVLLSAQSLDRKILNDSSVLIYPNTAQKQREHQELVTRSIYLANADVKQAQALVRTMAKTRDLFVDERLNLMVVRDTPEVVRLIERLVESIDLPEPEVMLEVEVLEVGTARDDQLGLSWPDTISYGLLGVDGPVSLGSRGDFRASVLNPALVATLKGTGGSTNLLANPRIRARNHEKAKVLIGDKLPVFTTTSTANVGVSSSVSYLDVGLKLEVEPSVQLDNDVIIKVALEVSNVVRTVTQPVSGGQPASLAYQIGTRQTTTSLRLRDGETQVISGLINDEDRKTSAGVPGLSTLPVLGKLFGVQGDTRNKTEVVLLITPRVIRNLSLPSATLTSLASGTDSQPGAAALRLRPGARAGVVTGGAGGASSGADAGSALGAARTARTPAIRNPSPSAGPDGAAANAGTDIGAATSTAAPPAGPVTVLLSSSAEAVPGGTVSVTLSHASAGTVRGQLDYDAQRFAPANAAPAGAGDPGGSLNFELPPQGQQVIVLRVLVTAAAGPAVFSLSSLGTTLLDGTALDVTASGAATVTVKTP